MIHSSLVNLVQLMSLVEDLMKEIDDLKKTNEELRKQVDENAKVSLYG